MLVLKLSEYYEWNWPEIEEEDITDLFPTVRQRRKIYKFESGMWQLHGSLL